MVVPLHQRDSLLPGWQAFDDLRCLFERDRRQCLLLGIGFDGLVLVMQLRLFAAERYAAAEVAGFLM
jgi:hypothetical protein